MSFDIKIENSDFVIKNGDLDTVQGKDKLVQDILKITLTKVGSNPLNPWYGSFISKTLIGSYLDTDIILVTATSQLQSSIENLKTLQQRQIEKGQKVSVDELIAAIVDISVNRNKIDPRLFDVVIKVLTKSYSKVNASFKVSNF